MDNRFLIYVFIGIACLLVLGCTTQEPTESKERRLAHASNDFAFDLMRSLGSEKNVFISPFSISAALAMVYIGAGGTTAEAMRQVLKYEKYGLTSQEVKEGFHTMLNQLRQNSQDYQLSTFNSLLVEQSFNILETYEEALREYYQAHPDRVDFATQGEEVKERINADVENATNGKIKDFLDEPPSADAKLFLLNAVYFLGNWKRPFDPDATYESTFYNNGLEMKRVMMMSDNGRYQYSKHNELDSSIVVLPYKGNESASMIIVLPNERTGVSLLEQSITLESLEKALETTRFNRILLDVPRFHQEYSGKLVEPLTSLGLGELFSNNADLSGIAESPLKVSKVLHKAAIDVNERGTEAAAATGVEAIPLSLPPRITVDHPFLFFIRDDHSGMILFCGRLDEL